MNGPHEERSGQSAKLEYRPPVEDAGRARASAARIVMWTIVGLGCLGVLLASTLLPSIGLRGRVPPSNRKCASNLRQIGLACIMYAYADPQGRFPPSFEVVLSTQDITSEVFCCPSSADERAKGATTQATVAQLSAGGHLSYIYVGSSVTNKDAADVVVAYEPLKNHGGSGMNVLFADGHVEFLTAAQGQALTAVAQSVAGKKVTWDGKVAAVASTQP
jgi:prepilin-type processing-associated H-X9-DG protein